MDCAPNCVWCEEEERLRRVGLILTRARKPVGLCFHTCKGWLLWKRRKDEMEKWKKVILAVIFILAVVMVFSFAG